MARRAMGVEDKQARRAAILEAARELFTAGDGGLPTAAEVAAATGLAKGTVYLYFTTKEEIFATVLVEVWAPVMEMVERIFLARGGRRWDKVRAFLRAFVEHLDRHPELLRLDALGPGVIEKNMTAEALLRYKRDFTGRLVTAAGAIDRSLQLEEGRGVQLLVRSYAMTRGLWQTAQHDPASAAIELAPALMLTPAMYFEELEEALTEYWRGALDLRGSGEEHKRRVSTAPSLKESLI